MVRAQGLEVKPLTPKKLNILRIFLDFFFIWNGAQLGPVGPVGPDPVSQRGPRGPGFYVRKGHEGYLLYRLMTFVLPPLPLALSTLISHFLKIVVLRYLLKKN